ncbi:MAG: serine/threonine protein kinase [Candidatus Eremiobacteraeota bacterium]|nr:serine/threonine protein kinase [Candidatus Eremiobacteraeota bacterium]
MNCGAPLQKDGRLLNCPYCDSVFKPMIDLGYQIPGPRPELVPKGLFEVSVGDTRYRILGRLAQGEHTQVLVARRAAAVTEQVVIKVASDMSLLEAEWANLRHLDGRCNYLDRLLPHPISLGMARGRAALVYRWRSGFVYNLAQIRRMFRRFDSAHAVWIWNRVLDQLTSLRQLGYCHGSLRPQHLLVQPRDHGIAFCGWRTAALGRGDDLAESGRTILHLLDLDAPPELRELAESAGCFEKPRELKSELQKVARAVYGPPRFRRLVLPGTKA